MTPAPPLPRRPRRSRLGSLGRRCSRNPRRISLVQPQTDRQTFAAPPFARMSVWRYLWSPPQLAVLRNHLFPFLLALAGLLLLRLGVFLRRFPVAVLVLPLALIVAHRKIGIRLDVFLLRQLRLLEFLLRFGGALVGLRRGAGGLQRVL